MEPKPESVDVAIIGGGLSGLTAAGELQRRGRQPVIFEASDRVGGRVRTDHVDGFTMDHGFQVLLTAYPTCRQLLDYDALDLRPFEPGAMIHMGGRFQVLGDPWRRPSTAWATFRNPVGTLGDKLKIAKVRSAASRGSLDDVYQRSNQSTAEYLSQVGFSPSMIDGFFRPFLGGVFLDESLSVSRRMFDFVFRFFAAGDVAVPAAGMSAIPQQLASKLGAGTIHLQQSVVSIDTQGEGGTTLAFSDGHRCVANQVIIATESNAAARLLGEACGPTVATKWNEVVNLYYSTPKLARANKYLHLCGDDEGPIQTAAVISEAASQYAPRDRSLISVSLTGKQDDIDFSDLDAVDAAVRPQVERWFRTSRLDCLAMYRVPYALPSRDLDPVIRSCRAQDFGGPSNVFLAGDHLATPSIEGAMSSGVRAARACGD